MIKTRFRVSPLGLIAVFAGLAGASVMAVRAISTASSLEDEGDSSIAPLLLAVVLVSMGLTALYLVIYALPAFRWVKFASKEWPEARRMLAHRDAPSVITLRPYLPESEVMERYFVVRVERDRLEIWNDSRAHRHVGSFPIGPDVVVEPAVIVVARLQIHALKFRSGGDEIVLSVVVPRNGLYYNPNDQMVGELADAVREALRATP
jgi:hypothetical protein